MMRLSKTKYVINSKINTKICHISDIHYCDSYNIKRFKMLYEEIKQTNPNYICITGDILDSSNEKNLNPLYDFIKSLSQVCTTIIVLGNHDVDYMDNKEHIFSINENYINNLEHIDNVILLRNSIYEEENITFIGIELPYKSYFDEDYNCDEINKFLNQKSSKYNVVLVHNPAVIFKRTLINIDLILCGHTHGGLIPSFIPGHFGIISPRKKLFAKNMRGIHNLGNSALIISSGIIKLSKRSKLMHLTDIFSMNVDIIEVIKSKKTL